jgi:ribosome small subunit-dependent GTPase A
MLVPPAAGIADDEAKATVGDWVLLEPRTLRPRRLLQRRSLLKRRAAGTGRDVQLIAANVDTLLVVSSCNQDFNPARLERYLALARACDVTPVIVLTKADLVETPQELVRAASRFLPDVLAEALDARDPLQALRLAPWCAPGQTVALVGSSGVGKSTLVNTLTGVGRIATQPVRLDDDRGRHTTTARTLHRLAAGGWLLDTPGMRELQLTDSAAGLDDVCRYRRAGTTVPLRRLPARDRARVRHPLRDRRRLARGRARAAVAQARCRGNVQHREPRPAPRTGSCLRQDGPDGREAETIAPGRVTRARYRTSLPAAARHGADPSSTFRRGDGPRRAGRARMPAAPSSGAFR